MGILDREAAGLGLAAHLAEDIADRDGAHLRAGHAGNFKHRHSGRGLRLDLDFLVIKFPGAQLLAKRISGPRAGPGPTRASDPRAPAASCARACTSLRLRSRVCAIAISTRS